jgi:hypothetical protein
MLPQGGRSVVLFILCCAPLWSLAQPAGDDTKNTQVENVPALTVTIRCEKTTFKVGDEIPVTFVARNDAGSDYVYMDRNYDRSGRMPEYELSAVNERGNRAPDPRAKRGGGIAGGLASEARMRPGEFISKTITLNRWALVTNPGRYRVIGTYHTNRRKREDVSRRIASVPISITIEPRSDAEMAAYIEDIGVRLSRSDDSQERAELVRKLMYTCDRRTVPTLIEATFRWDAPFWTGEAFHYYLPRDQEISDALLNAASNRGMTVGMLWTLKQRDFGGKHIKPLIDVSLSPDHPRSWPEGCLAAQQYSDDRFTPRLIAIATDPRSGARTQAIFALAFNRTDESVATLKKLLREPDPPDPKGRTIRQTTEAAIRAAYLYRGNTEGKRLRKDDFDAKYQQAE